uniref:Uncharacterized protein n=1 Tax=Ananas comosus var. bracteatus TaxID=296719 RepID=A0A6V7NRU8_ANACO|nr:unnamed protein product [Ananas comosus var. bracteatus]
MGRSPCCEKAHTNKGAWTKEEDERLIAHIREHGEGSPSNAAATAFETAKQGRPDDDCAAVDAAESMSLSQTQQQQQQQQRQRQSRQRPKCPDLNLELCISPPLQEEEEAALVRPVVKREGGGLFCFKCCGLGVKKEMMECNCNNSFLSLGMQLLDYRSLQMK